MQKNSGSAIGVSKFRIINSASEKDVYLTDGHWQTVHQLNWNRRILKTDILSGQTTNAQIANWVSYQEAYGSPTWIFSCLQQETARGSFIFTSVRRS